jgi:hypothetical protein
MGRVHGHHAPPGASGAVGTVHHKRAEAKRKTNYKVIYEEIAGKKKLKTVVSKSITAASWHTFLSIPNWLQSFLFVRTPLQDTPLSRQATHNSRTGARS